MLGARHSRRYLMRRRCGRILLLPCVPKQTKDGREQRGLCHGPNVLGPHPILAVSARRPEALCNTIGRAKVQVDDFGVQGVDGRHLHASRDFRQKHVCCFSVWTARSGRLPLCCRRASSFCYAGQGVSALICLCPPTGSASSPFHTRTRDLRARGRRSGRISGLRAR